MEGIARYIYETTKRMVLAHPEDEFHFFFDRPYDEQFIFADNVIAHVLSPQSRHPILWHLWFEWAVPKKLNEIKADVFLSGDMYLSLKTKVPTLMVSHDLGYEHYPEHIKWSHRKFMLSYSPKYHKKADHLIAVSEATKKDIIQTYQIPQNKITVAANAVPEGFLPLGDDEKKKIRNKLTGGNPYFIYVGSLHPRKNIANLLLAFDKLKSENTVPHKLVVFGRAAFKTSKIYDTFKKMDYKEDVLFIDDKNLPVARAMGAAEALCYVSLYEGFIVNPNNVHSIAEGMWKVASDKSYSDKLVDAGKIRVEKYSWDKSADTIFKELVRIG